MLFRKAIQAFAIPCYMATFVHSAPLSKPQLTGVTSLPVENHEFYEHAHRSKILVHKLLLSIPTIHKSCIYTETLKFNSSELVKLHYMAINIGIPSAPVLTTLSDNSSLETSLRRMFEGMQLHQGLLKAVEPRLDNKGVLTELLADVNDLLLQIGKMLRTIQVEPPAQAPTDLALSLPGEFDVQVAIHLTLLQLQGFGQDMERNLRQIDPEVEEVTDEPIFV